MPVWLPFVVKPRRTTDFPKTRIPLHKMTVRKTDLDVDDIERKGHSLVLRVAFHLLLILFIVALFCLLYDKATA